MYSHRYDMVRAKKKTPNETKGIHITSLDPDMPTRFGQANIYRFRITDRKVGGAYFNGRAVNDSDLIIIYNLNQPHDYHGMKALQVIEIEEFNATDIIYKSQQIDLKAILATLKQTEIAEALRKKSLEARVEQNA